MKIILLICATIIFSNVFAQEDFVIRINDTTFNVALEKNYRLTVDGKKIDVFIQAKDTLTYQDDFFSFNYPKELKVSKVPADKNVDQIMVLNAFGTGFLLQAYKTMNPETLTELLIEQVTKENTNYGYSLERTELQKTLKSGQTLKTIRLVQKYKENVRTYEVATYGKKDFGIAVVTFIMPNNSATPVKDVVELMWQSLFIK